MILAVEEPASCNESLGILQRRETKLILQELVTDTLLPRRLHELFDSYESHVLIVNNHLAREHVVDSSSAEHLEETREGLSSYDCADLNGLFNQFAVLLTLKLGIVTLFKDVFESLQSA